MTYGLKCRHEKVLGIVRKIKKRKQQFLYPCIENGVTQRDVVHREAIPRPESHEQEETRSRPKRSMCVSLHFSVDTRVLQMNYLY